jgi:hypothetical protein
VPKEKYFNDFALPLITAIAFVGKYLLFSRRLLVRKYVKTATLAIFRQMRQSIYILVLFFATTALGQTKDRRAELDIQGRIQEISVSPDEKIWLVTLAGNIYYTNNIDSNWHCRKYLATS